MMMDELTIIWCSAIISNVHTIHMGSSLGLIHIKLVSFTEPNWLQHEPVEIRVILDYAELSRVLGKKTANYLWLILEH